MNYGRGRTAIFATGGSWRWQMLQPLADKSHEMFYRQLLRWVVSDTPRHITGSTPKTLLADESHVKLRAEVRDKTYLPASDAMVEAHITGDGAPQEVVNMTPEPLEQGVYGADWTAPKAGSYIVEVVAKRGTEELGRDTLTFRREDGIAENFHVEQNRELLEKLSVGDRRAILQTRGRAEAGQGYQLLAGRHHRARDARSVGHAGHLPVVPGDPRGGMVAAAALGCHMKL